MQINKKDKKEYKKKVKNKIEITKVRNKKYLNLLGLCAKAGKLAYGEDVEYFAQKNKVFLVIIAEDMSAKSIRNMVTRIDNIYKEDEEYEFECEERNRKKVKVQNLNRLLEKNVYILGTKEENGRAVGKKNVGIIGVKDINFAKGLRKSILEEKYGE